MIKNDADGAEVMRYAIDEANYRMIDTAQYYRNEEAVGRAVRSSKVPRHELFITTKLFDTSCGRDGCIQAVETSLKRLNIDYIDQYLLHAPQGGKVLECYDVLLEYQKKGLIKSVGVSNFGVHHLEALRKSGRPVPAVNQIEMHSWWTQDEIVNYCNKNNIIVVGYSPLAKGEKLDDAYVKELAKKYNKSPAQILIRWSVQKGFVTIPKSDKKERIVQNSQVFDFSLSDEEMDKFELLGKRDKYSCTWNPTENPMSEFGQIN